MFEHIPEKSHITVALETAGKVLPQLGIEMITREDILRQNHMPVRAVRRNITDAINS